MDSQFINSFTKIVDSLKRNQRAELFDEEVDIVEELYTDPLLNNYVLNTLKSDQTTLLIGRRGSGKSTIINRFQHDIRKEKTKISLYIDVRTIYNDANDSSDDIDDINALSKKDQTKFNIYNLFIHKFIEEISKEINKNIFNKGKIARFRDLLSTKKIINENDFINELERIKNRSNTNYDDVSKYIKTRLNTGHKESAETKNSIGAKLSIVSPEISTELSEISSKENFSEKDFSTILKRVYRITEISNDIKLLLEKVGIKKVYICLDDCSELDKDALELFVKTIIAPLNNNSDGYYKFKIAFYPERNVLPEIDRQKVDTINLDYYELYKDLHADKIEEQAVNYVKRLIQNRICYFFKVNDPTEIENIIFDIKNDATIDEYYKTIFQMCSCVPRNIGKLLLYAQKKSISQQKPITKKILQSAVEEQYKNDIEVILTKDEFFQYKSYKETFSRIQLKNLLDNIINKARLNKKHIGESASEIFKAYNTNTAPSHFLYVNKDYTSNLLDTLEINFFITRISEQKDKDSKEVVVYVINYGLCQKESIIFEDIKTKESRKFRTERIFNYNDLILSWANNSFKIVCSECKSEFDYSKWEEISSYGKYCKKCNKPNVCELVPTFIHVEVESTKADINLKNIQKRILHVLSLEEEMSVQDIASELDVSNATISAYLRRDRILRLEEYVLKNSSSSKYFLKK